MKLLLDTHTLIWALADPERLSSAATQAISDEGNEVFVSVVSPWEITIKRSKGWLRAPDDLKTALNEKRFGLLPVLLPHTEAVASLPRHHGDPFDRMLVAQAMVDGLTLLTADRALQRYPVATLPAA